MTIKIKNKGKQVSILNDDIDYEPLYEGFLANLKEKYFINIEQKDIQWRGFWSQGDGLSFDFKLNEVYEVVRFLEAIDAPHHEVFKKIWNEELFIGSTIETVKNNFATNYCHSNTRDIIFWFENYDTEFEKDINVIKDASSEITEHIKKWYRTTCDEFYNLLEAYYQEQCSEMENFAEEDMTISDKIDSMIDPEMNIEKVVQMIVNAQDLSYTKGEGMAMVEKFIENFNKEYLIIKKIT